MITIFVLAQKSVAIAETVKKMLLESGFDSELVCSENSSCNSADENVKSVYSAIRERFRAKKDIVAILPMGIVVRAIEPKKKTEDPWVVCIEENGRYVIPVLNGHRGANEFATLIADAISAQVVITTSEEPYADSE
ncbi:cobalt-precorrin 5A hydrolase [Candidatus Methanophagaceae archaeon]|nr:cobalt-precorrin 5A hydrolase [Methanophagales archaeon]